MVKYEYKAEMLCAPKAASDQTGDVVSATFDFCEHLEKMMNEEGWEPIQSVSLPLIIQSPGGGFPAHEPHILMTFRRPKG